MIKVYGIEFRGMYFDGVVEDIGLDGIDDILIIKDDNQDPANDDKINHLFVIENGKILSQNDLKAKFKVGDHVTVYGGVVRKQTRRSKGVIYEDPE